MKRQSICLLASFGSAFLMLMSTSASPAGFCEKLADRATKLVVEYDAFDGWEEKLSAPRQGRIQLIIDRTTNTVVTNAFNAKLTETVLNGFVLQPESRLSIDPHDARYVAAGQYQYTIEFPSGGPKRLVVRRVEEKERSQLISGCTWRYVRVVERAKQTDGKWSSLIVFNWFPDLGIRVTVKKRYEQVDQAGRNEKLEGFNRISSINYL